MTKEEQQLMEEIRRDHPSRQFYDGPRPKRNSLTASEALRMMGIDPETRRVGNRQMQIHMDGKIY